MLLILMVSLFTLRPLSAQQTNPAEAERDVRKLLADANSAPAPERIQLMLKADARAQAMERDKPGPGVRSVLIERHTLTFLWMEIGGSESYQHDLLKEIVFFHAGEAVGARALSQYLGKMVCSLSTGDVPEFRTVIGVLDLPAWRGSNEPSLWRVRAEAYETWWSVSRMPDSAPEIQDMGVELASKARQGGERARFSAISAYRRLAARYPRDRDIAERLRKLIAGQDTNQRKWICFGD